MRNVSAICALFLLVGCAKTAGHKEHFSVVRVNDGVKITPAVVSNPAPVCNKLITLARLDKEPELQVFVDIEEGGTLCKSSRY